jgi:hypothetical protein
MRDGRELVEAIRAALLAAGYVLVEDPVPDETAREEHEPVGT